MPIYYYQCENCGEGFDSYQTIANRDKPTEEPCPKCNEAKVKKVITPVGFVKQNAFKGMNSDHRWAMNQFKKRHNNGKNNIPDY